jgi:hypothetical protein
MGRESPGSRGILVVASVSVPAHDLRIDDGNDVVLVRRNRAAEHAHLRRGEADAAGVVHQALHPLDEVAQLVVELLHWPSLHLQGGVGIWRICARASAAEPHAARRALRFHLSVDVCHAVGRLPTRWMSER